MTVENGYTIWHGKRTIGEQQFTIAVAWKTAVAFR
jgi:hypothetical protein